MLLSAVPCDRDEGVRFFFTYGNTSLAEVRQELANQVAILEADYLLCVKWITSIYIQLFFG